MTDELKKEFTLKISQANKTGLVVILYEMMTVYIDEAISAKDCGQKEEAESNIKRARGCLNELILSLNYSYPIAGNLLQLYNFANRELTKASAREGKEELLHVKRMIAKLHDAYSSIEQQDHSMPIMGNTQTVYAGLTYGRDSLNENLADQGSNRGFRA